MFLDELKEIPEKEGFGNVVSMKLSPSRTYVLYISTDKIWITKGNNPNLEIIASLQLEKSFTETNGYLSACGWLIRDSFYCMTNQGSILIYIFNNAKQIQLRKTFKHPKNGMFTSVDSYNGYVAAGDANGNLFLISPESGDSICHNLGNIAIKSIAISKRNGLILAGDGSTYSIDLQPQILHQTNYDLKCKDMEFNAYNIVSSSFANIAAAYTTDGSVFVTNFNLKRIISTEHRISKLAFGPDSTLFCISHGYIGILPSMQPKFRFYKLDQLNDAFNFVVSRTLLIISNENKFYYSEIINIPINPSYPFIYTRSNVTYYVNNENKIFTNVITKPQDLRSIKHCVTNGYYFAYIGCGRLYLYNTVKRVWIKSNQQSLKNTKHLIFHGDTLVVVHHDVFSHECIVRFLEVSDEKQKTIKTINLKTVPNCVRSDGKNLTFAFNDSVMVYNGDVSTFFNYSSTIAETHNDNVYTLARGRRLQCNGSDIFENVTNYLVDHTTGILIFSSSENDLYTIDLRSKKIKYLDSQIGYLCGLFTTQNYCLVYNDFTKEFSIVNYFGKTFASKIHDIEKLSILMIPIQTNPDFENFIEDGVISSLDDGRADKLVEFVRHKPSVFKLFPKPYYSATEILCHFLALKISSKEENQIIKFENDEKISKVIHANYSSLIRYIGREEGQVASVCCAIEVLRKCYRDEDEINNALSCVELPFPRSITDKTVQKYLSELYFDVVEKCVYGLVCIKRPYVIPYLCAQTKKNPVVSLQKFKEPKISALKCIEILSLFITQNPTKIQCVKDLCDMFSQCKYNVWFCACYLVTGNVAAAEKILSLPDFKEIRENIKASKWAHLLQ
ncbi:hypothetical protein TVAG_042980 [Trichomonas vaginalis G3]|uniref:Uncharacterized protein n=1 Tax=Trichomonas vaginalis (strain ATCC PRA-98 / G3) TaxID=412133 RepID=A2F6R2_TRIV3|nr:DPP6 N-terminal domain-like family [Trichomonas vaginalis G3]EAX99390.1 hypothetical protein TVAG_042980 [Trichomonas vaginalis G3]KAI5509282.1 DPP6 N-terminal domain-like family [Trichomonas vaginalis G3]|eukprot:XP_001312320.1 hypothetical protein [Trichomonas vaginalis G3]